jgi:hypothetical protein
MVPIPVAITNVFAAITFVFVTKTNVLVTRTTAFVISALVFAIEKSAMIGPFRQSFANLKLVSF